ncbi:MAG: CoA transferase [Betaproteobacteria bacterium]|nr:CoA transferase [Betaproteobacteria bacterium]
MSGPLTGVRVVDLTSNILGPVATQILGDMGADVIKIETTQGDPMRQSGMSRNPNMASLFMNTNRNKRSVVLDLKRPPALQALMRLIETADVFVHGLRPRAAARLGIAYSAIKERNPRIIYAYGPGYSPDGPFRDRPAFDDVIQGESGIAGMLGQISGEPRYVPMILADKICGNVLASAIGMALFEREKTGLGQEVCVPMLETMLSFNLTEHLWTNFFERDGSKLGYSRMLSTNRRPYATSDGHICLLAVNDEQWQRLLTAIGRPELNSDERFAALAQRTRNIDDLYAIVAEQIKHKKTAEWKQLLDAADIPNGAVKNLEDLGDDPYLRSTEFFQHYNHPTEGRMVTTAIPVRFSRSPGSFRLPPPPLGQDTRSILKEIGYGDAEIAQIAGNKSGTASSLSDLTVRTGC